MCAKDVALGDGCGTRTLECVLVCALECVSVGSFGPGLESPPFFFRRDCNLASTEESNAMAICRRLSVRPPAASPAGAPRSSPDVPRRCRGPFPGGTFRTR